MNKRIFTGLAIVSTLAVAAPLAVIAQGAGQADPGTASAQADTRMQGPGTERGERMRADPGAYDGERSYRGHGMHRMHGGHHGHGRHHAGGWHEGVTGGGVPGPRMLRGLDLSQEQRDRIFELRHELAPAAREQGKIVRSARHELRELALSADYDEAKARELGDRAARAMAELARLQAQTSHEIWKTLTDEQRGKLAERLEKKGGGQGQRS